MPMSETGFENIMKRANEIQAILGNKTKYATLSVEQINSLLKEAKEIATKIEAYQKLLANPNTELDRQIKESFFTVAKLILSYTEEHTKFFALFIIFSNPVSDIGIRTPPQTLYNHNLRPGMGACQL